MSLYTHSLNTVTGSFGDSGSFATTDKHIYMKHFISCSREYSRTKAEATANQMNRYLQILGVVIDFSTFDPNCSIVSEFFVSVHELMSNLDSRSPLMWGSIGVLQQACGNRAARNCLINTYNFLPLLTRILGDQLTREKKIKLLTLIQELTYGIKITWLEPHIPHLITTVISWFDCGDMTIVPLALSVLVNILYKNLPAVYTLLRCTDTKKLLQTVLSLQGPRVDVPVCKLMIILETINGKVSQQYLTRFVSLTFVSLVEAFQNRDVIFLRHIVEFFIDVKAQNNQRQAFAEFKDYATHIQKLIIAADQKSAGDFAEGDEECMSLMFEFLNALVQLDLEYMRPMHRKLTGLALRWVQADLVNSNALALLCRIAKSIGPDTEDVLLQLAAGVHTLLLALEGLVPDETLVNDSLEHQTRLTALLELLRILVRCPRLSPEVIVGLKEQHIRKIFESLLSSSTTPRSRLGYVDSFSDEAISMYTNAIALVGDLSENNQNWTTVWEQLLKQKPIHTVIAHAFCKGDSKTKSLVFSLAASPVFPKDEVATAMCESQSITDFGSSSTSKRSVVIEDIPYTIMSYGQEQKLDNLIGKLQSALAENKIANVATSDVMELFEYKMAAMGHTERTTQASLEAAGKQAAQLQQRVAQMSVESSRLHQMLYHSQQCNEEITAKLSNVEAIQRQSLTKLENKKKTVTDLEHQLQNTQGQLQVKLNELRICEERIENLNIKYREVCEQNEKLEKHLVEENGKNKDFARAIEKMEEKLRGMEKVVEDKKLQIVKMTQRICVLNQDINNFEQICKKNEETISQKDKEYHELQRESQELGRKLDSIKQLI